MSLSAEHTLIAAIPILVVLAVLSAAIIVFPQTNLDDRSKAAEPITLPAAIEPSTTPYSFPQTSD